MSEGKLVRYRKQCECIATASGPRVKLIDGAHGYTRPGQPYATAGPHDVSVLVRVLDLACDSCDMEWSIVCEGS